MPAMIYDASAGAWKEAATPRIWDASAQVYKDSTGLVWDEQVQAWVERWAASKGLVVGKDILLSQGTFKNCSPTYFDGEDGAAGFTITGTAKLNNSYRNGWYYQESTYLRWDIIVDFSDISEISYSSRRTHGSGSSTVYITDGLYNVPESNISPTTTRYAACVHWGADNPADWTVHKINTLNLTGEHVVSFVGGYVDCTGNDTDQSQFKNIIFKRG